MKRYFAIYRCLLTLNYHRALIHKADFFNGFFASILWGIFSVLAMYVLTSRSSSVFGWSRAELFVLIGVFNILVGGIFHMFFARNFDRFAHVIQVVELDSLLLKPLNTQFALSFWYISYHSIIRILLAILYTLFALGLAHVALTFFSGITFLFLGIFGIMMLYAFWFLVMTCIIWIPDVYNLVEFLYTAHTLSRYPPQVLWSMRIAVFFIFLPLTLIVSVPTKALLHTVTNLDMLLLIGGAIIMLTVQSCFGNLPYVITQVLIANMSLYFQVAKNTWDEMMTYRFNFMMWRIRNVLQLLTVYYLWVAVTPQSGQIFGYSRSLILTYVLGASLVGSIVFSSRTQEIGDNINNGELSQFLIRPLRYLGYWFARDIGDKLFNISFAVAELTIVYLILRPTIFLQSNSVTLLLTALAIFIAVIMNFFMGSLLGMIAFWSPEVWAPRFIFLTLVSFFAGGLFPLDILPFWLQHIFSLLPFGYLQYFPLQIYLGKLSPLGILQGYSIAILWSILLYCFVAFTWRKGLKNYSSEGN